MQIINASEVARIILPGANSNPQAKEFLLAAYGSMFERDIAGNYQGSVALAQSLHNAPGITLPGVRITGVRHPCDTIHLWHHVVNSSLACVMQASGASNGNQTTQHGSIFVLLPPRAPCYATTNSGKTISISHHHTSQHITINAPAPHISCRYRRLRAIYINNCCNSPYGPLPRSYHNTELQLPASENLNVATVCASHCL